MPIVLLLVGILLVIVAMNNKLEQLGQLTKESFTAQGNVPSFQMWTVAIVAVGALGYSKTLKPLSNTMLALVFLSIFLAQNGFFDNLMSAIKGKS